VGKRPTTVPLDFAARVRDAVNRSKYHGVDYVDVLNGRDLLLTPAKEREVTVEALTRLWREWDRYMPHEMLRRKFHAGNPCTPADMYYVMMEFLEEYIQHEKEKQW
jgi:hypothetical protein